ncbi:ribosomal protein L7/L12 [Streptomyces sp. Y7]|uniref:ribosomal protein L7/L12 n=1 Tax=Streptomyces sp. Y7 TaxID=3342392 RepID=UPI00371FDE6D
MDVVQVVRRLTGLSLWHSKVLATQVPTTILAGVQRTAGAGCLTALSTACSAPEGPETAQPQRKAPAPRGTRRSGA